MEPIDSAGIIFEAILGEIHEYEATLLSEADTRLKVIDRILTEVLGWPFDSIHCEPATTAGFVDYLLSINSRARLVVEAKRDGAAFALSSRPAGRGFRVGGPVFGAPACRSGINQAMSYCGAMNAELACVSNGHEWIVFRGSRVGDGRPTDSGMAFVFSSLEVVGNNFALFYDLLSKERVGASAYRAFFQEAEGQPIRAATPARPLRTVGSEKLLDSGQLAADLDRIMTTFFSRLTGDDDPDLLPACFVESKESDDADVRLGRIAESLLSRIRDLDTAHGEALTDLIRRATQSRRHEFVVLVGTKGAGKSTFISRFFRSVLPEPLLSSCLVARVNLADTRGDAATVGDWLDRALLRELEKEMFQGGAPSYAELEGIFYDEYTRLRTGSWAKLYEHDHAGFQIQFGDKLEDLRNDDPNTYVAGLIRNVANSRRKLPVLVFDNADHFDISFQESVYQYARALYETTLSLVIVPITDRTSWQLSRQGALQSFEHEALYLPTPQMEDILRKRIAYLNERIERERQTPEDRYFVQRGISISLRDLNAFARGLQEIFMSTSGVANQIGELANRDVRRALSLARQFIVSPHLRVSDLVAAYLSNQAASIAPSRATMALVRARYDIYPSGLHEFVQNVFGLSDEVDTTPLLGVRILQMLREVPNDEQDGASVSIDQVFDYCAAMGLVARPVELWLDALLRAGLCVDYDPTITTVERATKVELAPAGGQHLEWCLGSRDYVSAMADVTPVRSTEKLGEMRHALATAETWKGKTRVFIDYVIDEDGVYCQLPEHEAYEGQRRVAERLAAVRSSVS